MGVKDDLTALGQMAKKYLSPVAKSGAEIYIANLFDAFLEEKEGEIRRALGVHYSCPITKPLRRLFRDFIEDRNLPASKRETDSPPPAAGPIPREPAQRVRVNTVFDEDIEDLEEEPLRRRDPWE